VLFIRVFPLGRHQSSHLMTSEMTRRETIAHNHSILTLILHHRLKRAAWNLDRSIIVNSSSLQPWRGQSLFSCLCYSTGYNVWRQQMWRWIHLIVHQVQQVSLILFMPSSKLFVFIRACWIRVLQRTRTWYEVNGWDVPILEFYSGNAWTMGAHQRTHASLVSQTQYPQHDQTIQDSPKYQKLLINSNINWVMELNKNYKCS